MALIQPLDGPRELHGRRKLEVLNPATLEKKGEIGVATSTEVESAVRRARAAQESWAELGFDERGRQLLRVRDTLVERVLHVVDTVCNDTGKPRIEALAGEVSACCNALTFYAKKAKRLLGDHRERTRRIRTETHVLSHRPLGVVGVLSPGSLPLLQSVIPTVQALMSGNTVVLKPSEVTPLVGLGLAELFAAAGLPEGVFQVLTGDASTGMALVDAGCNRISFAGSAQSGRSVAEECARRSISCRLELGGNDPLIVCDDADLERASRCAVWGAFANSGQNCTSIERAYVVEKVAQPFVDRVVALTRVLRQGPESRGEVDVGSLSSPARLDVIDRQVSDAVDKGARVLTGGRRNPDFEGYFYEPTVLVDVSHAMTIMRAETFGPTLPVQIVKDEEEAVRLASNSTYRPRASLWTRDRYRARQLASRIAAARVTVNNVTAWVPISEGSPGAIRQSHVGADAGLESYSHVQSVVRPSFRQRERSLAYPYRTSALRAEHRALRLRYLSPLGKLLGS